MPKRVLDVGQCGPDHASIRSLLESNFEVEIVRTHQADDTLERLRAEPFDLVLINRKLDVDYSDGVEILKQIKADEKLSAVPVMLVTNYPEHQSLAVAAGAAPGFGKNDFAAPETVDKLRSFLA